LLAKVFRNAGAIAIGTGVGQGLVVLATPVLARVYGPAEFGLLALLNSLAALSMAAGCLRYEAALPSAPDEDVRGLLVTAVGASVTVGALAAGAAALLAGRPAAARVAAGLLDHPLLVGVCVALVGVYQSAGALMLRRGAYRGMGALRVAQGGGFVALAALPPVGLLWGHALSFAGGLAAVAGTLGARAPSSTGWRDAARRYRSFPLLSLPGAVLDVVGYSACIWVVASAYGKSSAGEFSQIQRLVGAPLMLVSMSLGQILLRHTADLRDDLGAMRLLLLQLLRVMAGLSAVTLAALAIAGRPVLSLLLGPRWHLETEMIVLVGATVFLRACVSPLTSALITLRRFQLSLSWQAAYFCSATLLMPFIARRVGFDGFVRFYAAHEAVFYGTYLFLVFYAVGKAPCAESSAS
jgi:O-antigen/teichoic acid export membrane protein